MQVFVDLHISVPYGSSLLICSILHYTTPIAFVNMTNASKTSAEVWASLVPAQSLFGKGIYGSAKAPDEYGSKDAILWNNYRAQINTGGEWEKKYKDNCESVWGRVDYCVPIIAAADDVYNAHKHMTMQRKLVQCNFTDVVCFQQLCLYLIR